MTEELRKGAFMTLGTLLANRWNSIFGERYFKLSAKGKKQYHTVEHEPEVMMEDGSKQSVMKPKAPLQFPHYAAVNIKPEDLSINGFENNEIDYIEDQPVSEEKIDLLFEDKDAENAIRYTKSTFTSNNSAKLDIVFYTYYSPEGIKCIREGERNPENPEEKIGEDEIWWEIKLESRKDYDKIMNFLAGFPQEDNFRFTTNEDFWNDFLNDAVNLDDFHNFYAWTDHGEANMGKGEYGESVGINKARLNDPNAKYFNDQTWIGHVWTEEEMWAAWNAKIEAASAAQGGTGVNRSASVYRTEKMYSNAYFKLADDKGMISYKGTTFICDQKTNALKLGDCSNLNNCIRIALADGGSLIVNRDNIDELVNALSMFSSEDVGYILKAIHKDNIAQKALAGREKTEEEIVVELQNNSRNDGEKISDEE